ncbi:MAG: alpha/beta hydrolase [Alphaproteobacteria bacterium]|nr:alpha/beta hydrolase [Alphaproteobacteria bacterium]
MIIKEYIPFPLYTHTPIEIDNRCLHIWLPNNYYETDEKYPVLYMFDGHNLFFDSDATYGKCWGLKEYLENWGKQIIVVGLECSHEGNNRLREFSPYFWGSDFFGDIYGTGDKTMEWMVNELKPWTDTHFRTWSHREATGIAGSSMGGLMSLYAVIKYNHIFSKAACLSSAITFCSKDLKTLIKENSFNEDTRVYLSWGSTEGFGAKGRAIMNSCHNSINKALLSNNISTFLYKQPNGHHCEADWEKQNAIYMNWLWCS